MSKALDYVTLRLDFQNINSRFLIMKYKQEIERRRTFAIVSHPDAGKTTLTEKLLLFGGAIHVAGAVKSNKIKKTATSDFMEIERQRGISVATSVMGFEYKNAKINILDTPGHQDFAEDTFRTLTAVDSVIVVVDAAKGVERQTEKLMKVCRMRKTPVIVFINKVDRDGKDSFDLLDEIEEQLDIKVCPLSWNIGMGHNLQGIYDLYEKQINLFENENKQKVEKPILTCNIDSDELDKHIGGEAADKLRDDYEYLSELYPDFDIQEYMNAEISPVFFGSALNNFGVQEMLDCFIRIAPSPRDIEAVERNVTPYEEKFSGFVFKIHANMDPNHRNRLAFVKVCSGRFERNKNYLLVKQNKRMKFANPTAFMADKKETIDFAYPGDIVGLYDSGIFRIGDSITEGEKLHYKGLPSFSPEMFRYIENANPLKYKQLAKGIDQLMDEGVAQLFTKITNNRKIIGTVGALQFEVIEYRLEHEYGANSRYEVTPYYKACWISPDESEKQFNDFKRRKEQSIARDKYGRFVFLAESAYALQTAQSNFPDLKFHFTTEF